MHRRNGDPPYRDCEDALRYWLKTTTRIALRLETDDTLTVGHGALRPGRSSCAAVAPDASRA